MPHDTVNPATVFRSLDHGFSQGVVASGRRTLFVSGQTAWDADRAMIAGADLAAQATRAFANVRAVVEAAGATVADIVMVRIYIVDYRPPHAAAVGDAFRAVFAGLAPACSWIGVAALADPAFLIEVEAVAVFD